MRQKLTKLLTSCVFVWICGLSAFGADSFYMLPYEQDKVLNALKNALQNAQSEIKISIYSFTHNDIAKILRDSAKRGVQVHIIYDKESNANNKSSTIGYLAKYNNISVCLLSGVRAKGKKHFGIMHQKMAIIDRDTLIIGSANWSKNAFENNFETLLISHDKAFITKALQGYDKMMNACVGF
ncbi:phospholipase D-like domain-containing protein [Helicobacter typhlonius]|uniref:phospholipase D-like domain-containing protein n=1 Tax=Helicobacter typhlonius TaxID=76936 RepID=UPI002FE26469